MNDSVILITGGTNGIGKQAAFDLARMGGTIVITARDAAKGARVVAELKTASGNDQIDLITGDLSRMADCVAVAKAFKARYSRLDVLLNNAGAIFDTQQKTADGYEQTFALNHLSYFLLARELMDVLKASAPARIVNVASGAHIGAKLNFDDLMNAQRYSSMRVYGQSKLANIMFSYALARRLAGTGVTTNALHPGFVNTGFGHNGSALMRTVVGLMQRVMALKPEQGAETMVYLASSPEVAGKTGLYWEKCKPITSSAASMVVDDQERWWMASEAFLAKVGV